MHVWVPFCEAATSSRLPHSSWRLLSVPWAPITSSSFKQLLGSRETVAVLSLGLNPKHPLGYFKYL